MPDSDGYRRDAVASPRLRTDIVDVYIYRRTRAGIEFLQLLRASEPLAQTWHPVMGHVEKGETAVQCALRELDEEIGLRPGNPALRGMWALEQVHPFYVAAIDQIVLSPRFTAQVAPSWKPQLNDEHAKFRWVRQSDVARRFMWPGQLASCKEIIALARRGSLARDHLAIALGPETPS